MSHRIYTPEFKDEAVRQVVDRGYAVKEVAERLGIGRERLPEDCGLPIHKTID